MRRTLVLLTWNEIEALRKMFDKVPLDVADEVLAIDGGSTDGTQEYLRERGLRVVVQDKPGRGYAMRLAAKLAKGENIVFFSLDGNEDPNDVGRLFKCLEDGADLTIASRMMREAFNEEDVSWWRPRKWVNNMFTLVANALWSREGYVTDTINGFRGISKQAFDELKIDANDFTIEYQMSIRAMQKRLKIVEIPTHEGQRLGGESKAESLNTGLAFISRLWAELGWARVPLAIGTITLLSFLYPGYLVFRGDQRLFLPWMHRDFNPELYVNDPVASVDHLKYSLFDELAVVSVNGLGVDFFVWLFLVAVIARVVYFYGVYRLAFYFTRNQAFSFMAPLLFMTNMTVFGSGMDTMIYETHYRTVSVALSLIFLVLYLNKKRWWSLLALGGALTMNPLTVPPFFGFLVVDLMWRKWKGAGNA